MIVYNVTIQVEEGIAPAWLQWLKAEHIPEVMASGCFVKARIHKLLAGDQEGSVTYIIQYDAESKALYNLYIEKHASLMRDKSFEKWGNKFIAFRTLMQVVN